MLVVIKAIRTQEDEPWIPTVSVHSGKRSAFDVFCRFGYGRYWCVATCLFVEAAVIPQAPQGKQKVSRLGETRDFKKSKRLAYTRALFGAHKLSGTAGALTRRHKRISKANMGAHKGLTLASNTAPLAP